jgi:putative ABC transport system permease protein
VIFRALVSGHLLENGLRSVTTVVAIALGVAIVLAIDLANATAIASFASSVNAVSSQTNLQIVGVDRGFDERVLRRIRVIGQGDEAQPVVEGDVTLGKRSPSDPLAESLHVIGIDLLSPVAAPSGAAGIDPYLLVAQRGAFVSQRVAQRYALRANAPFTVIANGQPVAMRVAGVLPPDRAAVDSSVVFVDIATAQEIFGKVGLLDRIDFAVEPSRLAAERARLTALLPAGARIIEPAERSFEIRRMLRSFQLNLTVLSYIALLVAASLVYNAVAVSVVQRREEIATLRALGASRRSLFATFALEGALFGAAGSLAGVLLGAYLAQFSVQAVAKTVSTLYADTHVDRVVYDPSLMVRAFLIGVVLATASAAIPALIAAGTRPASALRARGSERRIAAAGLWWFVAALILFGIAAFAARLPAWDGVPVFGYVAGLACIVGGAACVLPGLVAFARFASRAGRRVPLLGRLAAGNLGSSPRRSSVAIASLAVAVATLVSVAVLIASLRATVLAWSDDTLRADLFVSAPGTAEGPMDTALPRKIGDRIAALPGVEAVDTFRSITIPFAGSLTTLAAIDARKLALRGHLRVLSGPDPGTLAHMIPDSTDVLASQSLAERFGVQPGDSIPITTTSGRLRLRVRGIFSDYSSDAGLVLIDRGTFARLYGDDAINSIAVYARSGTDLKILRSRIVRSVAPRQVDVQTTRELRDLVAVIFDRTFAITYALFAISVTIAILGVVGTLFALVLERRREIGVLRYLGLSARSVGSMVLYEAGILGVFGALYGTAVGVLLSLVLIFVIDRQAFGWLVTLEIPWSTVLEALALVVVAALLGGLYPARVAARIRTDEAVRSE